jgi:hypothetical protein
LIFIVIKLNDLIKTEESFVFLNRDFHSALLIQNDKLKLILKIFFVLFCVFVQAQKKHYFLIDSETKVKKKVKDSASAVKFLDSLAQTNYFFTQLKEVRKKVTAQKYFMIKEKFQ